MAGGTARRARRRALSAVLGAAALLASLCTGPASATGLATATEVCGRAASLTAAALPQQALALLDRLDEEDGRGSGGSCVARERRAAVERIGAAALFVAYADGRPAGADTAPAPTPGCTPPSDPSPDPDAWRDAARACDAENEGAAAPPTSPSRSQSQQVEDRLRTAVAQDVLPWEYAALLLLLLMAVGAVLARLLHRLVPAWTLGVLGGAGLRGWSVAGAWLLLLAASAGAVRALLEQELAAAAVGWVLAVLLLAWTTAGRMRLLLTVRGADGVDQVATGHVLALLGELGTEAPRGLETVLGTDVKALDAAGLLGPPQGKLASALFQLVQVFWRQAPWEVTVSVVSPDLHAVHVSRNGREFRSAVVDRHALALGGSLASAPGATEPARRPDLHRMTAAVVLCALQQAYGFDGLAGATSWRSVGLQYIATTDHHGRPAEWELLARAVDDDPDNKAALLALWHARYRHATDQDELATYVRLLRGFLAGYPSAPPAPPADAGQPSGAERKHVPLVQDAARAVARGAAARWAAARRAATRRTAAEKAVHRDQPLVLRAQYALLVALVNRRAASLLAGARATADGAEAAGPPAAWHAEAVACAGTLQQLLDTALGRRDQPARALACRLQEPTRALRAMLGLSADPDPSTCCNDEPGAASLPRSPVAHYQHACHLCTKPRYSRDEPSEDSVDATHVHHALRHLWLADTSPELSSWRAKDPQLAQLRKEPRYTDRYGREAIASLAQTPTFLPYADRLALLGITEPQHVRTAADHQTLATGLGVTRAVAWHLARFADLVLSVPDPLPRYDVAEALWARGCRSVTSIREAQRTPLAADLAAALSGLKSRPTEGQLEEWFVEASASASRAVPAQQGPGPRG